MRDAVGDEGRLGDGERGAGAMEVAVARLERVEDVPGESQVALEFLAGGEPVAGPRGRVSRDSRIVARVGLFLPGRRARAGVWGPDVGEDGRCAGAGGARAKGDRFQAAGGCPRSGRRASRLPRRRRHPSTQRRDGTASAPAKHGDAEGVRRSNRGREPRARSPSMRPTRSDLGSLVQSCGAMPSDGACCPRRGCAVLCPEVPKSTHLDDLPSSVIPALGPRPCSLRRVNPTVAAAKETSDMDHMNHMNHMNHGGGLRGHDASGGGGMGHSMKGMPVAFEWGHRVTLFFDGWATETSFDYVLALFGLFLLCVAQEQLYHFRTSLRMSRQEEQPGDLSAPIVPKPFRYVPHSRVLQLLNSPPHHALPPRPASSQRPERQATSGRHGLVRSESRVELPDHARGDDVQRWDLPHRGFRHDVRAFFGSVQAPRRRGAGLFGGMPARGLDSPVSGTWTERRRARPNPEYNSLRL